MPRNLLSYLFAGDQAPVDIDIAFLALSFPFLELTRDGCPDSARYIFGETPGFKLATILSFADREVRDNLMV